MKHVKCICPVCRKEHEAVPYSAEEHIAVCTDCKREGILYVLAMDHAAKRCMCAGLGAATVDVLFDYEPNTDFVILHGELAAKFIEATEAMDDFCKSFDDMYKERVRKKETAPVTKTETISWDA